MPPPDFAAMRKDPLMVEAKALGVQTRKEVVKVDGTKHRTWRSITDVAAECRIEWERRGVYALQRLYARLCQRSLCLLRGGRRLVHCSRLRGSMLRVFDFKSLMFLVISVTVYFKSLMCLVKSKS